MSFGYQQAAWIKESASYGSAEDLSTGTRYTLLVKPANTLEKTLARIKTEHLRGMAAVQQAEDQIGIEAVAGSIGGVIPWKGDWGILLKHAIGKVVTSGAFVHTYTWTDLFFPGFSIAVNRAAATYVYDGCQVAVLKLASTVGGGVEWTAELMGKTERQLVTITVPTLPALHALPYALFQHATFEIDDVVEPITSFELNFTNELESAEDRSYALGSGARALLARSGFSVTGTIKRRHDKDSGQTSKFYAKFLSGVTAKLEILLTHPTDAAYSGVITLGACRFEGKTPSASDRGFIAEEIPFTCYDLDAATSSIVINDVNSAPATATGAYDGAGA